MTTEKVYLNGKLILEREVDNTILFQAKPEWPTFLRPFRLLAKPTDKGLGDIIERVIGPVGGDAYKAWYKTIFGKPCRCTHKQDKLNERFPL